MKALPASSAPPGPAVMPLFLTAVLLLGVAAERAVADAPPVSLTVINAVVEENFDTLPTAGSTNTNVPPPGFHFLEAGTGGNALYSADAGSNNAGNTYSYGSTGNTDRALGELTSGTVQSTFGVSFRNNTGEVIDTFSISYTGELWRLGAADATSDRLDFQFSLNATALNNGTWTDVNGLDFVTPASPNPSGVGAKNGNLAENRQVFFPTKIIPSSPVPRGGLIFLRWVPTDISSNDDGLAIDDLKVSFQLLPTVITSFTVVRGTGAQSNLNLIAISGTAAFQRTVILEKWDETSSQWVQANTMVTGNEIQGGTWTFNLAPPASIARLFYRVRRP